MQNDRHIPLGTSFVYRHPMIVACVRIAVGVWLLVLTGLLHASGRSAWWAALLVPAAVLHFYLAYRATRLSRGRDSRGRVVGRPLH